MSAIGCSFTIPKTWRRLWQSRLQSCRSYFFGNHGDEVEAIVSLKREQISDEVADVAAYLFELADNLKIDLGQAVLAKLEKNALKYPADKARGSNTKYTDL